MNIKMFLPPILIKIKRKLFPAVKSKGAWEGDYLCWNEALENSTGYDADLIIDTVKTSTAKVRDGLSKYVRDGFLFNEIDYAWPLAAILQKVYIEKKSLYLIDFGGGLGSSYHQNSVFLSNMNDVKWIIVEQEKFVNIGKQEFQNNQVGFYNKIEDVLAKYPINLIIFSGVLQCIEDPFSMINTILESNIEYIFIDRTGFINDNKKRICLQIVSKEIYNATYPSWFFVEKDFLTLFSKYYDLIFEFKSYCDQDQKTDDGKVVYWKGFLFRKK